MRIKHIAVWLFLMTMTAGCGLFRRVPHAAPQKQAEMKNLMENIERHRVAPERMQARWSVDYNGTEGNYSFGVSVFLVKDSALLFNVTKFSLPVARLLVTPGKVAFYENIRRTAYEGDPSELSKRYGIPFDFDLLQSIVLGNVPEKALEESRWQPETAPDSTNIRLQFEDHPLLKSLDLNTLFRVTESLWQYDGKEMQIRYPSYNEAGYPERMDMQAPDQEVHIRWKKIRFPEDLDIHFRIPEGYKRIELRK